jgi:hypothetical protein
MRTIAALVSGYILWTALWLGGNVGLRAAGVLPGDVAQPLTAPVPLFALLFLALVCSLSGGYVAAAVSRSSSIRIVALLGLLLFATGCFFQSTVWNLMPLWYHIVFLGMIIPVTLVGGAAMRRHHSPS